MSAIIYTAFLLFGFTFGDLKFSNSKLPGSSISVLENNILDELSRSHGVKFEKLIGDLVKFARHSKMDTYCSTYSNARKYARGTSKIVIPLVLVFKLMVVLFLTLAVVKFILLKGSLKIALIILGVIFARKLQRFGTLVLLKNHQFYFGNGPGQYPTNEPNLSGYGYEYTFVPGFQTPEQKYSSLTGKGESQKHAKQIN